MKEFCYNKLAETAARERLIADRIEFAVARRVTDWATANGGLPKDALKFVKNRFRVVNELRKSADSLDKIVTRAK